MAVFFVLASNMTAAAGGYAGQWNREDTATIEATPAYFVDDPSRPVRVQPTGPIHIATTTRPNIVVLMLDDMAAMDSRIWDRLPAIRPYFLEHGLTFSEYFGNDPLCCPGRTNFLTGLYTDHTGVWTNDARLFDPADTLATELHASGYATMISGKYLNLTNHLTKKRPPGWTYSSLYGGGYYNYTLYRQGKAEYHDNDVNDYAPDVFTNEAVQQMRNVPADKPIFAYEAPFVAHAGNDANGARLTGIPVAARRYQNNGQCTGLAPWDPPNYNEADVSDKPAYIQARAPIPYVDGWPTEPFCDALLVMDQEFTRIRKELTAEGRFNNTLFILTTDNGMEYGAHRVGTKYVPYATQMPLFMFWADGRPTAPATVSTYLSNVDMAPTLCELGGCTMGPYPDGQAGPDGQSFLGLISGTSTSVPTRDALYEENRGNTDGWPGWRALRTNGSNLVHGTLENPSGLWHYIENDPNADPFAPADPNQIELYDTSGGDCWNWFEGMPGDPCELTNVANDPANAPLEQALHQELQSFITNVDPRIP